MSLGQLNNSTCPRATLRQDIPVEHRALLPQTGLSPGERQGSPALAVALELRTTVLLA